MKKNFIKIALFVSFITLSACNSGSGSGSGSGGGGDVGPLGNGASLQENFKDFVGQYLITTCESSQEESGKCKFQTAEVKFSDKDGLTVLVIEMKYDKAEEHGSYSSGIGAEGESGVKCQSSYGKVSCNLDGDTLNSEFTKKSDGSISFLQEGKSAKLPENNFSFKINMVKK